MNRILGKRLFFVIAGVWTTVFFAAGQNYRLPLIPIEKTTFQRLSNGLTLGLCPHPEVSNIFVRVELTGLPDDNKSRLLANLGMRWLAGSRSEALEEKLNTLRANLQVDGSGFSLDGPAAKSAEILKLSRELLLDPELTPEYFLRVAGEWQQQAKLELEDPNGIGNRVADHWIFRDTFSEMRRLNDVGRYGELRENCRDFLNQYLNPGNVLVQVVAQETDEELMQSFAAVLERWEVSSLASEKQPNRTSDKGPQVALVQQQGNNAFFKMLLPVDVKTGTREAVTFDLLQTLFAGFPGSPLNRQLAREFNLPLGVLSGVTRQHGETLLVCNGNLPGRDVPLIASLVMEKLMEMSARPIPEEYLQQGRNWIARLYRRKLEQPSELANMAAAAVAGGYDFSYHVNYLETLNSITSAELQQLAARLINREHIYLFVAGDVKPMDAALAQLDADGETSWFNSMGESIAASFFDIPEEITAGEVLNQLAKLHGREQQKLGLNNWHLKYKGVLEGTPISLEAFRSGKDKLRLNVGLDEMEMNTIYAGNGTFISGVMGQQQPLDPLTKSMLELQPLLFPEEMVQWVDFGARISGVAEIESERTWVMELETSRGFEFTAWVDVQSGMLKGIQKPVDGRIVEVYYFDYEQISGIWVPQRIVLKGYGPYPVIFRLDSAEWNVVVDESIFQPQERD